MESSLYDTPAIKKDVNEITENDKRIQILGTVVEYIAGTVGDSSSLSEVILSDGTGNIRVFIDEDIDREYKPKEIIRVFGRVGKDERGLYLNAEIIQDMNKLNIDLYKKIRKLRKLINNK